MSETKWTPGPWCADGFNDIRGPKGLVALAPNERRDLLPSEIKANAHLIAAAPDLYEALDDLVKAHQSLRRRSGYAPDDESDSLDLATAALARARRARGDEERV